MQESIEKFVKKLIRRLEKEKSDWNEDYNVPINNAIKIVNQLAEEQKSNLCKWGYHRTIDDIPMYKSSCQHELEERLVKKYKFCPYCGKGIKVMKS